MSLVVVVNFTPFFFCVETWVLMVLEQVVFYKEWGCLFEQRESRGGRGGEERDPSKLPLATGIRWIILHCFYSEHVNVTLFAKCIFFLWSVGFQFRVQHKNNPLSSFHSEIYLKMENWSVDQVCKWLRQMNLGELVPKFRGKHFCCLCGVCSVFLSVPLTTYFVLGHIYIYMLTSDFYRNVLRWELT